MPTYILYRIAYFLANSLPLKAAYGLASFFAYVFYLSQYEDRAAIIGNFEAILGPAADRRKLPGMVRELYRNFAKYLVDFLRSSEINEEYIRKFVKVEGARNIETALAKGRGVIMLSAHIGNWELGGSVISLIGYPISAVVLPHRNKKVGEFFKKRRLAGKLTPIDMGSSLKACYHILGSNNVLGLLGDRDFTGGGLVFDFFDKPTRFPKGPYVFSCRLGSPIVPTLIVRLPDDTFKISFEEPIYADAGLTEEADVTELAKKCISIIESYVKKYPTQWYVFKNMWTKDD